MLHRLKRITSIYRTINENDYIVTSLLIPEKQNILLPIKKKKERKIEKQSGFNLTPVISVVLKYFQSVIRCTGKCTDCPLHMRYIPREN